MRNELRLTSFGLRSFLTPHRTQSLRSFGKGGTYGSPRPPPSLRSPPPSAQSLRSFDSGGGEGGASAPPTPRSLRGLRPGPSGPNGAPPRLCALTEHESGLFQSPSLRALRACTGFACVSVRSPRFARRSVVLRLSFPKTGLRSSDPYLGPDKRRTMRRRRPGLRPAPGFARPLRGFGRIWG